jgi:hypothetical protein
MERLATKTTRGHPTGGTHRSLSPDTALEGNAFGAPPLEGMYRYVDSCRAIAAFGDGIAAARTTAADSLRLSCSVPHHRCRLARFNGAGSMARWSQFTLARLLGGRMATQHRNQAIRSASRASS